MGKLIALAVCLMLVLSSVAFAQTPAKIVDGKTMYVDGKNIIRIKDGTYNGTYFIDIRECYKDEKGETRYTSRGVSLKKEQLEPFIKALGELL